MGVTAVIGLQWGDEGKGKVVDVLGRGADVVVRCQGGANAGHTVVVDGRRFVLHLVPSGMLRDGITCVIGDGVAVDLEVLERELNELADAGLRTAGRLMLSRRAHVVLPLHKRFEIVQEELRGRSKLGTTRRGIGPAYSDKYARVGIRVGDILYADSLPEKVKTLLGCYTARTGGPKDDDLEETVAYCRRYMPLVRDIASDTSVFLVDSLSKGREILLEGSQGFLLDIDHGTYPFVTSCNTGTHGLATGAGLPFSAIDQVVGVVKSYVTRVGEGPLPTEMEEPYQGRVREKGNEYGATTGRPRRCGWMDLNAIRYSSQVNGVTSLAITRLDTLAGLDMLKLAVAYEYFGNCVDTFPADVEFLEHCVPRYAACRTWEMPSGATSLHDLPPAASEYVQHIVDAAGCGVRLLSCGPGRDDLVDQV